MNVTNLAIHFPPLATVPAAAQPLFRVTVGGRWRPDLYPVAYEQHLGSAPRVRLAMTTGQAVGGTVRRLPEMALRAVAPDELVRVDLLRGGSLASRGCGPLGLFEGYIDGPAFSYGPAAEEAGFWAVDRSAALLSCRVERPAPGGLRRRRGTARGPGPDVQPRRPSEHVGPGRPRARRAGPGGSSRPPAAAEAQPWTTDQAANYLSPATPRPSGSPCRPWPS